MESIVGLSVKMLVLATLVMAIGAALQAAVGLGLALFVVPLLALIDVRLIPGPVLLASVALAVMMAYRGRAAINRRELTLPLWRCVEPPVSPDWHDRKPRQRVDTGPGGLASRGVGGCARACAPRPLRNHAQHGGTKAVL